MGFGMRQDFAQSLQCGGMRMTDGYRRTFCFGFVQGQLQLFAYRSCFGDIVEKRDVAEGGANAEALRGVVSNRGGCGAAIDVEKMAIAEDGHEFRHECRIGRGLRTLMIINSRHVGDILQELIE